MSEIVFVIEPDLGRVTVESSRATSDAVSEIAKDLGQGIGVNCARPDIQSVSDAVSDSPAEDEVGAYVYRSYHNSVIDGPGRRSVVQFAGCSIRCPGCYVPETHKCENGRLMTIADIVAEVELARNDHDGVTILGGEPFDQPQALMHLATSLKSAGFHILIYTGRTIESLRAQESVEIETILESIDVLIDGPFIIGQSKNAGEYRGSRNQRILHNPFG